VSKSLQMFGVYGYSQDMPLERMMRGVRMFQTGEGTTQAQLNMIARAILKERNLCLNDQVDNINNITG